MDDDDEPLVYYKLTLRAFGSGELKTATLQYGFFAFGLVSSDMAFLLQDEKPISALSPRADIDFCYLKVIYCSPDTCMKVMPILYNVKSTYIF